MEILRVLKQLGKQAALAKLGMQLTFDTPQEAQQHYSRRGTVGKVTGFAGDIGGGLLGGAAGGAVGGLPGGIAGSVAGGVAGEKLLGGGATTMFDVMHDLPQKARHTMEDTRAKLDTAAGLPSGVAQHAF